MYLRIYRYALRPLTPGYTDRFHDFTTEIMLRALKFHCKGLGGKEVLHADQAYCPKHQIPQQSKIKTIQVPKEKHSYSVGVLRIVWIFGISEFLICNFGNLDVVSRRVGMSNIWKRHLRNGNNKILAPIWSGGSQSPSLKTMPC